MSGYSYPLSFADVVERLFVEFEDRYPLPAIFEVARECRQQLDCAPNSAVLEMLERLARQRLNTPQTAVTAPDPGVGSGDAQQTASGPLLSA